MKSITPELLVRGEAIVGECPKWIAEQGQIYWVDIQSGIIHRAMPDGSGHEEFEIDDLVTSLNPRASGGFILTLRKSFAFFDPATAKLQKIGTPEEPSENRFNDAQCDRQGRLWAGTMSNIRWNEPSGYLYRLDPDLQFKRIRSGVVCSNGTGWSPDSRTLYHTESFLYTVFAYDFDPATGAIENRRPFVQLDPAGGEFPDGLTVDAEGCVWSAHVGKGRIVQYDPAGRPESEIQLPVTRGTSCGFGGEGLTQLFITTARETLTAEQLAREPLAGSLFVADPGVTGLAEAQFRG